MRIDLEQLERDVERELAVLNGLPAAETPSAARLARIKAALVHETRGLPSPRRWHAAVRTAGAIAAAVAVMLFWRMPLASETPWSESDPDAFIDGWLLAADQSSDTLAALFDDPWLAERDNETMDETAIDDFIESLDRSLGGA